MHDVTKKTPRRNDVRRGFCGETSILVMRGTAATANVLWDRYLRQV